VETTKAVVQAQNKLPVLRKQPKPEWLLRRWSDVGAAIAIQFCCFFRNFMRSHFLTSKRKFQEASTMLLSARQSIGSRTTSASAVARRRRRCPIEVVPLEGRMLLAGPGDMTAPVTVAILSGVAGHDGYFRSPVTVDLLATDVDDPANTLTTYSRINGGPLVPRNIISLAKDGIYDISYFSRDPAGNFGSPQTLIVRIDQTAPKITAVASPTTIWPPNNKLVPIHVTGHVTDNLSGVASTVTYHVVDEYGQDEPSGTASVNSKGNYSFVTYVQASRLGQDKDGRQYIIDVTASDLAGNLTTASDIVTVPHDQGKHNGNGNAQKIPAVANNSHAGHGHGNNGHGVTNTVVVSHGRGQGHKK